MLETDGELGLPRKACPSMSSIPTSKKNRAGSRRSLHVVIDQELDAMISSSSATDGISTSAIVRDALRAYFKLDDPRGRGWREGYAAGIGEVQRRMREAIVGLEVDHQTGRRNGAE
jgi:hypothetical protein